MLSFPPGLAMFAVAGALAACGPLIIHLLNRRRYRVLHWAAMDFLRQAMQRNRKILQIRDLLLLLLRTAALLLFGLALARPFLSRHSTEADANQPLHAILVVDNSLSMGYREKQDETLLDQAKRRAGEYIRQLPERSRISVIPLGGSESGVSFDPYRTKEDALAALDKLEVVDRRGSAGRAIELAREACKQATDLPTKRVVLLSDQQHDNWNGESAEALRDLPELQVVDLSPLNPENTWVGDFRVQDSIADVDTPTKFVATIRHEGPAPRPGVQVTLSVDGVEVQTRTVNMEPGQAAEVAFADYRFEHPPEAGRTNFIPAKVSIAPDDRLSTDNERHLVVPVMAAAPVVFVDQYGEEGEDVKHGRIGETRPLRKLLDAASSGEKSGRGLIKIRHVKIDQLDRKILADVRSVVIAGVKSPEAVTPLLREFVDQGGQLVIAAGGDFNAAAWNEAAWLDGAGILPGPLQSQLVGRTPQEAPAEVKPFFLDFETMSHGYFQLPDVSRNELSALYNEPLFFKAVVVSTEQKDVDRLVETETNRLTDRRKQLADLDARQKQRKNLPQSSKVDAAARQDRESDDARRAQIQPQWLSWSAPAADNLETPVEDLAARSKPRLLAGFTNGLPFMVSRTIGRGNVLLVSTSLGSSWNNLPKTNAWLIFDRILRAMLQQTLPERNVEATAQLILPIDAADRSAHFRLTRPNGKTEDLAVDALGADSYGVTLRGALQRGIYRVSALRNESSDREAAGSKLWEIPLAVNGSADESDLTTINEIGLDRLLAVKEGETRPNYVWIHKGDAINPAGAQSIGQGMWRWLAQLVLICLLVELAILAWPLRFAHLAIGILLTLALLKITNGTPVGALETRVQYLVLGLGGLAAAILLALHFVRPPTDEIRSKSN